MKLNFATWFIHKIGKWLIYEPPTPPSFLTDFERLCYEIRQADVLLVEGNSRVSKIIKQITQSNWSHSALYIGRIIDIEDEALRNRVKQFYQGPLDAQLVIESLMGRGTTVTPLSRYRGFHIRICRPQGLTREDAQKVVDYAINMLGMRYSVRHIVDLFRFLFPWGILPRRWRSSLFEHNALKPTEEICSSLIAYAFGSVDFPILPHVLNDQQGRYTLIVKDPRFFTPKDFDYSPYFNIIKYPIMNISEDNNYHNLPWRKEMISDGENIYSLQHETDSIDDKVFTKPGAEFKKPASVLKTLKRDGNLSKKELEVNKLNGENEQIIVKPDISLSYFKNIIKIFKNHSKNNTKNNK